MRGFWKIGDIFSDWFFYDISSETCKFSVMKEEITLMMPCEFVAALCWFQYLFSNTLTQVSIQSPGQNKIRHDPLLSPTLSFLNFITSAIFPIKKNGIHCRPLFNCVQNLEEMFSLASTKLRSLYYMAFEKQWESRILCHLFFIVFWLTNKNSNVFFVLKSDLLSVVNWLSIILLHEKQGRKT